MTSSIPAPDRVRALLERAELAAMGGLISENALADLEVLKRTLQIGEGDILIYERERLARLLTSQFDLLLEDCDLTPAEDFYQASLQDVFDIGFDDYLGLIRPSLTAGWLRLDKAAESDLSEDRFYAKQRLENLRPLCRLAGVPGA